MVVLHVVACCIIEQVLGKRSAKSNGGEVAWFELALAIDEWGWLSGFIDTACVGDERDVTFCASFAATSNPIT